MSSSSPTLSDMQRAVRDTLRVHWQLFLAQGVIMVILGILAIIWPGISTLAVDVYVGWLFLLSGIVGIFTMFLARTCRPFYGRCSLRRFRCSSASCCSGIRPKAPYRLPWCLPPSSLSKASSRLWHPSAIATRSPCQWGWMLASGIADLILAEIIMGWPIPRLGAGADRRR